MDAGDGAGKGARACIPTITGAHHTTHPPTIGDTQDPTRMRAPVIRRIPLEFNTQDTTDAFDTQDTARTRLKRPHGSTD